MDWRVGRKNKALRNALNRFRNIKDKKQLVLLQERMHEANEYLEKLGKKTKRKWFK